MSSPSEVAAFLDSLRPRQVPWVPQPAILGFLATSNTHGSHPSAAVVMVDELSPGSAPNDVEIRLRGQLPRALLAGETITVSINRYERYCGYQIKTRVLSQFEAAQECYERRRDRLLLHGRRTYTTHHSPYELQFCERVPFDEVLGTVGAVDHAVLALGVEANISPRLLFHHELRRGILHTYHGDGLAMKTFLNLCENPCAVMLIFDFEVLQGYSLLGRCEEVSRNENARATEAIDRGFKALGFGRPNRIFRHSCDLIETLRVDGQQPREGPRNPA